MDSRMWYGHFTVTGKGRFPLDMLRYDGVYPSRPEDVAALTQEGQRTVRLTLLASVKDGCEPSGRWASFGWPVINVEQPYRI